MADTQNATTATPDAAPPPAAEGAKLGIVERLKEAARDKAAGRSTARPARAADAAAEPPVPTPEPKPEPAPDVEAKPGVDVDKLRNGYAKAVNAAKQWERKAREQDKAIAELREQLESDKRAWSENPIEAAKKRGLTLKQWVDQTLNGGDDSDADAVRAAVPGKIEKELAELKAQLEAQQKSAAEAQVQQVIRQELQIIDDRAKSSDRWAMISRLGRQQQVHDRFYQLREQQGFSPRLEDVLDEVSDQIRGGAREIATSQDILDLIKQDPDALAAIKAALLGSDAGKASAAPDEPDQPVQRSSRRRKPPVTSESSGEMGRRRQARTTAAERRKRAAALLAQKVGR